MTVNIHSFETRSSQLRVYELGILELNAVKSKYIPSITLRGMNKTSKNDF